MTKKNNHKTKYLDKGPLAVYYRIRSRVFVNVLFSFIIPLITVFTLEWIARGTLGPHSGGNGFFQALIRHIPSFLLSYLLLVCIYVFISQLTGFHALATLIVGLVGNVPAAVTHFKLTMRNEPFLPWDISQIKDLMGVKSNIEFTIPANVWITIAIFVVLAVLAGFVRVPKKARAQRNWKFRLTAAGTALACTLGLMFGVFLNKAGSAAMGIVEDAWMQDRYYRTNGVLTGFLTNLQLLRINQPDEYSTQAVNEIAHEVANREETRELLYPGSFAENEDFTQAPDIIFLMAESFWDVTALPGISYDEPVMSNFERLSAESAYGQVYSPSFGGGTCDVEFEALTGFSMEFLPAGSKPFQQYITDDMFALPHYLKGYGYNTLAIHGYGRRFWNRDVAYPRLGIDEFIASEDFVNPDIRRGFISDDAMVDRIIEEYELREDDGPMFIHAVTMQNHTTYGPNRYPPDELVNVVSSPESVLESTIVQLEDCATGIREMDAALGRLADYLDAQQRPAIIVFWGDHMNPMSDGYNLFEDTGFIGEGENSSPLMYQTPLLIWSNFSDNFSDNAVDVGTVASYNITPVMMELFGMEKPLMFEFLTQQLEVLRARSKGIAIMPNGDASVELNAQQQEFFNAHQILQYDYMFGERVLEDYIA